MKLIKHFFQTFFMVGLVCIVSLLPQDPMADYINPILGILITCVLFFTIVYLYKGRKKGMFCLTLLLLSFVTFNPSFAQTTDSGTYYREKLNEYRRDFCSEVSKFDPEKAVKNNEEPDEEMVRNAVRFTGTVDRAVNAGYAERNFWTKFWAGEISGKAAWWTEDFSKQYECAAEFLEEVAEYKILKREDSMATVYKILKADKDSCWPCGIIHLMIESVEKLILPMEKHLKDAALSLLGIMTLFWILVKVLILIGQFGTASNADFFTELLVRLFLVVIAAAILQAPLGQLYQLTFSPMVSVTSKLTQQFSNYGDEAQGIGATLASGENLKCKCCEDNSRSDCNGGELIEYGVRYNNGNFSGLVNRTSNTGENVYEGLLDLEAKKDLMCMTCMVYKQTAPMVAAGRAMTYFSIHTGPEKLSLWRKAINGIIKFISGIVFPYPIGMWFVGVILILVFTWLSFCIAFKTIDIFLRFGFVVLLTPFLVTAYVFPISRKYTQRGWEFLVHSMVSILALGIGIAFVMAIFKTGMPEEFKNTASEIMQRREAETDSENFYASDLWHAFIGAPQDTEWDSGKGGGFFPLLWMIIICFMGTKILNATGVIVEALSGISAGVPSIAGAAVMGAIRTAYAPFKMSKKVLQDRLDAGFKTKGPMSDDKDKGTFAKLEKWALDKSDSLENVGKAAGKTTQATGDAIEKGGTAAGKAAQATGKGMTAGGQGLIKSGAALSGSGIGAIIGVPLMVVGAAAAGAGYIAQGTGHVVEKGSKVAGKAVKASGKVMEKAGKVANKLAKPLAKGVRATSRFAGKVNKKVQDFKKKGRAIKNRMKKMVPPKVRKHIKDRKKHKQEKKKTRRKHSMSKYTRGRLSSLLDNMDNTVENALSAGDNSFGK